ncbi:MAG TPA: sialidase family protein [Acidimicrobiales bacterium]|nr:sialidase family protein [Acidimicrobiales bacterium]
MRRGMRAGAAVAVGMVVAGTTAWGPAGAKEALHPTATAAVQVTADPNPTRAHSTPLIARNPKTGVLVIADSEARTKRTVDVYRSFDDGRTWAPAGDPMLKPWTDASGNADSNIDHSLTYDKNGVLYIAFQANDPQFSTLPRADRPVHVFLAKSTDDGATFSTVKVYEAPEAPEADRGLKRNYRPWVAVDPNNPQFVYVSWMQFHTNDEPVSSGNKALITSSDDGGKTFAKPFSLREGDPQGSYEGRPAVDGKGVVHVVFAGRGRVPPGTDPSVPAPIRNVLYRSSSDHGRTWTDAREIDQGNAGFSFDRKWALKADPNSDNLYAVWYGNPDPRATRPQADRDIYMRVSHDSGATWEDRVVINTDSAMVNVQHYDPNISIAPNGRVDITWYDFRNSPTPEIDKPAGNDGGSADVYYRYSLDGGRTFSDEVKVTDRIIDRRYGVWSNNSHIHAPIGIVSTDDTAYITWQDSRNGTNDGSADDTYFATVRLKGTVQAVGDVQDDTGVPRPILVVAGLAGGMGLAMILVAIAGRRRAQVGPV